MKLKLLDWASNRGGFGTKLRLEFETDKVPPRYDPSLRKNWVDFPIEIEIDKPFEDGEITPDMFVEVPTQKGTWKIFFGLFSFRYEE